MGLLRQNPDEKFGCVGWFLVGVGLIVAGIATIMSGVLDALW